MLRLEGKSVSNSAACCLSPWCRCQSGCSCVELAVKSITAGHFNVSPFVEGERKLRSALISEDRACAEYWGSYEVVLSRLVLVTGPRFSSLGSLKPWTSNKHRTLLAGASLEHPLHLHRAGCKHARQHSDVGVPDEHRDREEKGTAAYKHIHKEIPYVGFGLKWKKVCKCTCPDFKDTEHESEAKGRYYLSQEDTKAFGNGEGQGTGLQ